MRSPDDELDSFEFPSDVDIQLVASEPMIQDPVVIKFDEDGRLWVVEMRGFMQDIDGIGEHDRVGRISILLDTNADDRMDSSIVYLDSLIMPRALAIIRGGALIAEDEKLWFTQDLNNDLHADTKTLIDSTYAGSPLPEHSGNGLWRGIDSWFYNVKSSLRYRYENGNWIRDSTEFRGQWGLSHDDEGRLIYNYNWSQLHADLVPPNCLSDNKNHTPTTGIDYGLTTDRRIYPIRSNPAVNRGYVTGTLDENGRLLEFTAACSPFYYRGNVLPNKYYGNVFVCEPSGNLIKRNVVKEKGYYLSAFDPTPGEEFLASTDERFRPVSFESGPDGALYVVDMYRGLIQHGKYITEYLREQTLTRQLDKPVHCGRIWRIGPQKFKPKPNALSKTSNEQLIKNLSDPNGWTRDMSQRLLIERKDSNTIQALEYTILDNPNPLARFHALWTLYGMQALKGGDWPLHATADTSVLVSNNAFRLLELLAVHDVVVRIKLQIALFEKINSVNDKQVLQLALSSRIINADQRMIFLESIMKRYDSSALMRDVALSGLQNYEWVFLKKLLNSPDWETKNSGKEILFEMLTVATYNNANANDLTSLLNYLLSGPNDWRSNSILTGLSTQTKKGTKPIRLKTRPEGLLKDAKSNTIVLNLVNTIFTWPGHEPTITTAHTNNGLSPIELKQFANGRQLYLTTCAGCHGTNGDGVPRFAPTLVQSEWVVSDEKKLALVVLHGIEGPIDVKGIHYDIPTVLPVMPAHTPLDDGAIANILTYIRNAWGNNAPAVAPRTVGVTRNRAQGRVQPWTVKELDEYLMKTIRD